MCNVLGEKSLQMLVYLRMCEPKIVKCNFFPFLPLHTLNRKVSFTVELLDHLNGILTTWGLFLSYKKTNNLAKNATLSDAEIFWMKFFELVFVRMGQGKIFNFLLYLKSKFEMKVKVFMSGKQKGEELWKEAKNLGSRRWE